MTTSDGKCCGNCEAFMRDRFDGFQGACAVIDDECIAYGMYHWTTRDGDCGAWEPRKKQEHEIRLLDGQLVMEVDE